MEQESKSYEKDQIIDLEPIHPRGGRSISNTPIHVVGGPHHRVSFVASFALSLRTDLCAVCLILICVLMETDKDTHHVVVFFVHGGKDVNRMTEFDRRIVYLFG